MRYTDCKGLQHARVRSKGLQQGFVARVRSKGLQQGFAARVRSKGLQQGSHQGFVAKVISIVYQQA